MMKRTPRIFSAFLSVLLFASSLPLYAAFDHSASLQLDSERMQDDTKFSSEVLEPIDADSLAETSQIFRYVDRDTFEKSGHVRRMQDRETSSSYAFLNEDGSITEYILKEDVKFQDENGISREKDIALIRSGDGSYKTKQNNFKLTLPAKLSQGVTLAYDTLRINLKPVGELNTSLRYSEAENSVYYDDVFGDATSLRYTPTLGGFKEDILLERYTGVNKFEFTLKGNGLNLYQEDGKYYLAKKEGDAVRYQFSDILIVDADFRLMIGDIAIEQVKSEYHITITVPEDCLTNPDVAYPVCIDPTVEIRVEDGTTKGIHDATIFSGIPNTNTGSWIYMSAGYVGYDTGTSLNIGRAFIKLPGLYNSSWYANVNARDIQRVLFYVRESSNHAEHVVNLYPNVATGYYKDWTESNVTWNRSTVTDYNNCKASASIPQAGTASFDITQLVCDWKNGVYSAELGFTLRNPDETVVANNKGMYTTEYSSNEWCRPYVTVQYADPFQEEGTYYINSREYGKYFHKNGTATNGVSGTVASLGSTIQWVLKYYGANEYTIQSANNSQYLACNTNGTVTLETCTASDNMASRYLWKITSGKRGGTLICSVLTSRYLYMNSYGTIGTTTTLGSVGTTQYNQCIWRPIGKDVYECGSSSVYREVSNLTSFANLECKVGSATYVRVVPYYTNELWSSASDFTYSGYSSQIISIDAKDGKVTGLAVGSTTVTALHKVTNRSFTFVVTVRAAS